jgi:hypothetical protein
VYDKYLEHWVVAVGDPFDGTTLYGPFTDYVSALEFSQIYQHESSWIVRLVPDVSS